MIRRLLKGPSVGATTDRNLARDLRVATCALFVEMGRIDESFTPDELERVVVILKEKYGLSKDDADALIGEADRALEESLDLWQFARLINENYSNDEKVEIVEMLWRIIYVDGKMDAHEHYLMAKLKNLLRLDHHRIIEAKRKVLHGDGRER
ncbi:MAG: TerB family tellurite resistance protein [Desulfobacterales bacterium]|nr:TerB family tellurite resistance protein [Desulfobacterales bacterium]